MFSTDGTVRNPVVVYKAFHRKDLYTNNIKSKAFDEFWFKSNAVGINKLGRLMKVMTQKAGLTNNKLRNHCARKTMVQTFTENEVPTTQIAQISGHKCCMIS